MRVRPPDPPQSPRDANRVAVVGCAKQQQHTRAHRRAQAGERPPLTHRRADGHTRTCCHAHASRPLIGLAVAAAKAKRLWRQCATGAATRRRKNGTRQARCPASRPAGQTERKRMMNCEALQIGRRQPASEPISERAGSQLMQQADRKLARRPGLVSAAAAAAALTCRRRQLAHCELSDLPARRKV